MVTKVFELSAIDRHFADFILGESQGASAILKAAVSLLSSAVGSGDICLNLAEIAGKEIRIDGEAIKRSRVRETASFSA